MKEIRILQQQLRNYPNNWFVYPLEETIYNDQLVQPKAFTRDGLVVCDKDGEEKGFIQLGTNDGKVIID